MKIKLIILFFLSTLLPETNEEIQLVEKENEKHISLIIHQDLINSFFNNMGEIKGKGTNPVFDYTWYLLDPRVEIKEGHASFHAKVRAKTKNFRTTKDVIGTVKVSYNKDANLVEVKVDEADVVLDIDVFGKEIELGRLDIAKYFSKSLKLKGPQAFDKEVDFTLPNGEKRKIDIDVTSYQLKLIKNAIELSTSLDFKPSE